MSIASPLNPVMKILLGIIGSLIALAIVAFFVVALSLGSIVKGGVNKMGPQLTQSKVELASARISPFSGQGTLSDLVVGNPAGWQSDHAFSLGQISIDVQPRSLLADHVVVNSISIDRPEIVYETRITTSNLQDLMKNIQQAAGSQTTDSKAKEGKQTKIEVKSFRLENAKITAIVGTSRTTLDMPTVVLENLGTKEGGLTPQELTVAVMKAVTAQAVQAAGRVALDKGLLEKAGVKAGDGLRKLLGGDKNTAKP